jgi:predicted O-methyltransferase YrrM
MRKKILFRILGTIVLAFILSAWHTLILYPDVSKSYVKISVKSSIRDKAKLYYDRGSGFNEADSRSITLAGDDHFHDYLFMLLLEPIKHLRFDPPNVAGCRLIINHLAFVDSSGNPLQIINLDQLSPANQIKSFDLSDSELVIVTGDKADDPQINVALPKPFKPSYFNPLLLRLYGQIFLEFLILCGIIWMLMGLTRAAGERFVQRFLPSSLGQRGQTDNQTLRNGRAMLNRRQKYAAAVLVLALALAAGGIYGLHRYNAHVDRVEREKKRQRVNSQEILQAAAAHSAIYANKHFSEDWFTDNIRDWAKYKPLLGGRPDTKCLEIGAFEGRSTLWIAEYLCNGLNSTVDTIDTFEGSAEHQSHPHLKTLLSVFQSNLKTHIDSGRVVPHQGKSKDVLVRLNIEFLEGKRGQYSFVYIDGAHEAKNVAEDFMLSWDLLAKGGILAFDDYTWDAGTGRHRDNPRLAIDFFLEAYSGRYEIVHSGYQLHIKKITD